jgi:hypothetical protein
LADGFLVLGLVVGSGFLFDAGSGLSADGFFGLRTSAYCGFMLIHQWRWWQRRGATARGGGYFFPLRRKKVTKKGATSL